MYLFCVGTTGGSASRAKMCPLTTWWTCDAVAMDKMQDMVKNKW